MNSIDRLTALAPVQDSELVAETDSATARRLLAGILGAPGPADDPPRRSAPRVGRRLALPALGAALAAVAVTVAVLASTGGEGTGNATAATLEQVSDVARAQAPLTLGPGQFVYTKSVDAYTSTTFGPADEPGTTYSVLVPHVREIWLGPSGGRLVETSGTPQFLTEQDREAWLAAGRPDLTEAPTETALDPTPPLDLPTDPDALYAQLEQEAAGTSNPVPIELFTLVGDSLRETAATPAQRAALYQVAARIPGVELLGPTEDSAGRSGVAVALDAHGIRFTLIFDPDTSALLAEQQTALPGNSFGYAAGTRVGYATYLVQKIVDSDTAQG